MTKTTEEAAKEYADNAYYPAPDYGWYESDDEQMKECLSNAFKAGANYVYGLPLASRLTAEEKERVRKVYESARDGYWDESNDMNIAVESVLEDIFGKELFK